MNIWVRRTAEIFLCDADDWESILAKYGINGIWGDDGFSKLAEVKGKLEYLGIEVPSFFNDLSVKEYKVYYTNENGDTLAKAFSSAEEAQKFATEVGVEHYYPFPSNESRPLHHRRMSNNSIAFTEKPSREMLNLVFTIMRGEGEPGFINLEQAAKRRLKGMGIDNPCDDLVGWVATQIGLNPCAEILLDSYGVCNLTTVNVDAFVVDGSLDVEGLMKAQELSARAGLRMTLVQLEIPHWNDVQQRDRLLGTSLTGWKDALAKADFVEEGLLTELKKTARETADRYAKELRVTSPLLVTTVKPEGTLSQVAGGVSSGLHWSHSPYYIRRIRINAVDPLVNVVRELGWPMNPEVGTPGDTHQERMNNAKTYVIDFPIASGAETTKDDVSVQEQFDTYFTFQKAYAEHNSSNTITVKPHEWGDAEQIVWDGWDNFVGVSFLSHDGGTYQLAPYEAISKEQYEAMVETMKPFDHTLLYKYEGDSSLDGADSCDAGVCPIR